MSTNNHHVIHVIHHTHWDQEWNYTFAQTNVLFEQMFNNLAIEIKTYYVPFLMGGQVCMFDDWHLDKKYISILKDLVSRYNFQIGPWYNQPDLRLTTRESLIRNLKYGQKIANNYGKPMPYAYTPNAFGANGSIATLYNHLNLKWAIIYRGVDYNKSRREPIFRWGTPDNNVLVYNLITGYKGCGYLDNNKDFEQIYENRIKRIIKYQSAGKYKHVPLLVGGDITPFNVNLVEVVAKLNNIDSENKYILSTLEEFIKAVEKEIDEDSLVLYKGDFDISYGGAVHKTVSSTRMDIKKLISNLDSKMTHVVEPLYILTKQNFVYPEISINKVWTKLLASEGQHAYSGANPDNVNRDIKNRLIEADGLASAMIDLVKKVVTSKFLDDIILFNLTPYKNDFYFKGKIIGYKSDFEILDGNKSLDFITLKSEKISNGIKQITTTNDLVEKPQQPLYAKTILLKVHELAPFSVLPLKIKYTANKNRKPEIKQTNYLDIFDLKFCAESGDAFNHAPEANDEFLLSLKNAKLLSQTTSGNNGFACHDYAYSLHVPSHLNNWLNKICDYEMKFNIKVIVHDDDKFINVTFDRIPEDIHAAITFKVPFDSKNHYVNQQMGYVKKENIRELLDWKAINLLEVDSNYNVFENSIYINEDKKFYSLYSDICREYIFTSANQIDATLFRTHKYLKRNNLLSRATDLKYIDHKTITTPDSHKQLSKISYNFVVNNANLDIKKTLVNHEKFKYINQIYSSSKINYAPSSLANINTKGFECDSTIKKIYDIQKGSLIQSALYRNLDHEKILRLLNPLSEKQDIQINFFTNVELKNKAIKEYKATIKGHEFLEFIIK